MSILTSLSRDLMMPESILEGLIRTAPHRYKVYAIDKRNGQGKRVIAQPARQVKALQHWVMNNVLADLPVHNAAMGYRKGRSIRTNAAKHAPQKFLLKLDFQDFFPSIRASDLAGYFSRSDKRPFSEQDIEHLQRILFWKPKRTKKFVMSIGAPSSPLLSNILMYDFDSRVQKICTKHNVKYTRYADDLTFSTNRPDVLRDIEVAVAQICRDIKSPRLKIKEEKTVHASMGGSRRVTGLVLSNEGIPSLGHSRKRQIRAEVHHFLCGKMPPEDGLKLRGTLAFVNSAEPDFLARLKKHYGSKAIAAIMNFPRK